MKSRRRDPNGPEPLGPWSEVAPRLWMGGHFWVDDVSQNHPAAVAAEFDLVISLIDLAGHGPDPGVEHLVAAIPDDALTAAQILAVQNLATAGAQAMREGRKVLVRCRQGYNRSGLVVAQILVELGHETGAAIDLIRKNRSIWALNNEFFVQYLATGLEVARLLSELDPSVD